MDTLGQRRTDCYDGYRYSGGNLHSSRVSFSPRSWPRSSLSPYCASFSGERDFTPSEAPPYKASSQSKNAFSIMMSILLLVCISVFLDKVFPLIFRLAALGSIFVHASPSLLGQFSRRHRRRHIDHVFFAFVGCCLWCPPAWRKFIGVSILVSIVIAIGFDGGVPD